MRRNGFVFGTVGLWLIVTSLGVLLFLRRGDQNETRRIWHRLAQRGDMRVEPFHPRMVDGLPDPTKRYLPHSIQPGTPIAHIVVVEMDGAFRTGRVDPWLPMRARRILAPADGFVWNARADKGVMRFAAADVYSECKGRTRVWLLGILPVVRAGGPDISRSARNRMAIEVILNPAELLPQRGVRWESLDEQTVRATMLIDGESIP